MLTRLDAPCQLLPALLLNFWQNATVGSRNDCDQRAVMNTDHSKSKKKGFCFTGHAKRGPGRPLPSRACRRVAQFRNSKVLCPFRRCV